MKTSAVIARCEGLSHRKLDYWCEQGVFGDDHIANRRENPRDFSEEDLRIAQILARVSAILGQWSGGRGGYVALYSEIARQVRAGKETVHVNLAEAFDIFINVNVLDPPQVTAEPTPAPAPADEPVEPTFIPGVGVDHA